MKKISVLAIAVALILWGLSLSPQGSVLVNKVREIKVTSLNPFKNEKTISSELPQNLAEDLKKVNALVAELDIIKSNYEEKLKVYKKLDTEFTALIKKSRENPNPELIKKKEAVLEEKLMELTGALESYQEKSRELYKFQTSTMDMNI